MLLVAFLGLVAISACNAYRPDLFLTAKDFKNWHDIFMWSGPEKWNTEKTYAMKKMCEIVKRQKYGQTWEDAINVDDLDRSLDVFNFRNKRYGRKHMPEVEYCCRKPSTVEKKLCFKDMRENYLDMFCDIKGDHVCCKSEMQNRYTCFGKNVYRKSFPYTLNDDTEEIIPFITPFRRRQSLLTSWEVDTVDERLKDLTTTEPEYTMLEDLDDMPIGKNMWNVQKLKDMEMNMESKNFATELEMEKAMFEQPWDNKKWTNVDALTTWQGIDTTGMPWDDEINPWKMTMRGGMPWMDDMTTMGTGILDGIETRKCTNNMNCMAKMETMTDIAAQKVCRDKMVKGIESDARSCCRAGTMVGKTVGRKNREVCVPALFKFQRKAWTCMYDKQTCKQTFLQCCHENAEWARETRGLETDIITDELEGPTTYGRWMW